MLFHQICRTLSSSSGGVFALATQASLIPAVLSMLLKYLEMNDIGGCAEVLQEFSKVHKDGFGFFAGMLSFMIVFRTSFAYQRYDAGFSLLTSMRKSCIDAASSLLAFTQGSDAPPEEVQAFMTKVAILISCLQGKAIVNMRGNALARDTFAHVQVLSLDALEDTTRDILARDSPPIMIFNWIQRSVMDGMHRKILVAAPPMVGRTIAQLSCCLDSIEKAREMTNLPFPGPYEKTILVLLMIDWAFCPLASLGWSDMYVVLFTYNFILVFIYWALYQIAVVLEMPFGDDEFDIDCLSVQEGLNRDLQMLLSPEAQFCPKSNMAFAPKDPVHGVRRPVQTILMKDAFGFIDSDSDFAGFD